MAKLDNIKHTKLVEKILKQNEKEHEILKTIPDLGSVMLDRKGNMISFADWIILRKNEGYRIVTRTKENQFDILTTWEGNRIFTFETKLFVHGKMYALCPADEEEEALKTHDRFIFAVDQKMFNHIEQI